MSGEEPGYVFPDHKTTAEFRVPGGRAEPEAAAPGPEATFVDEPVDDLFDSGATLQDFPEDASDEPSGEVPVDDPEDDPDATFQDPPVDDPADPADEAAVTAAEPPATRTDAPSTITDGPAGGLGSSVTASDIPAPFTRSTPPEAIEFEMPEPEYGQASVPEQATAPEDAPAALHEQAVPHEQAPVPDPGASPEEALWTERFAAEAEQTNPGAAGPAVAHPMPGSPSQGPAAPPEATAPGMPAASPSGGVPPAGPARSRRPLLLVGLAAGAVLLLAAAGVAGLLLIGGSGNEDKAAAGGSPAASAPATEGGGPAPATPGGASPSGAPAAPPATGGPSGPPPGEPAPSPVPTAPIGPVMAGNGITYQLVQQAEGYFEGRVIITNRTDEPMKTWTLTFRTPGADVKNIWGAKLVKGGEKAEIENLDDAPAIPPGGTWDVQFGAAGITTTPEGCKLNGKACGF